MFVLEYLETPTLRSKIIGSIDKFEKVIPGGEIDLVTLVNETEKWYEFKNWKDASLLGTGGFVGQLVNRLNEINDFVNLKFIFNESRYKPTLSDLLTALQKPDPDFAGKQLWERFNRDEFMKEVKRQELFGTNIVNYQNIEAFFTTNFNTLF